MNTLILIPLILVGIATIVVIVYQGIQIRKLQKSLQDLTNQHYVDFSLITDRYTTADEEVHSILREIESEVKEQIKKGDVSIIEQVNKSIDKVRSEIPRTNDEILVEVQQMRDDFLALRQNL
jgi:gas vesicle protein